MLTASDCLELGIVDSVVPEPEQGAHTDPKQAALILQSSLMKEFAQVSKLSSGKLLKQRYKKFRKMGELSSHSREAMGREIELLLDLSAQSRPPQPAITEPKKEASADTTPEAPLTVSD